MYQGEVFIEESKLSSFLHTAALLQVKGLTGVTHQNETFSSPRTTTKLYTQLTISSKSNFGSAQKEAKVPALKKRRSSTSDKPNDIVNIESHKKTRVLETCDLYNRNNGSHSIKVDNPVFVSENHIDNKVESKADTPIITTNGKSSSTTQGSTHEEVPVSIKTEWIDDNTSASCPTINSENDDSLPDYENSMLARSLLSGINPSKSDITTNTAKKVPPVLDLHCTRQKETNAESGCINNAFTKSPKSASTEEAIVKCGRGHAAAAYRFRAAFSRRPPSAALRRAPASARPTPLHRPPRPSSPKSLAVAGKLERPLFANQRRSRAVAL
ncbi:unnamed protein product, partial [Iphiclides podalirius]